VTEEKHESVEFLEDNEAYCDGEVKLEHRPEYLDKIERRIREYKITELQAPRAGKKLLVLDIDYTFFDHKSVGSHIDELTRPYIHHLLTVAYPHYDIAIWSATSMKWIYSKLGEMRLFASEMFKISLLVDSLACISVYCEEDEANVNVKPLAVIWGQYPQYSASNTIMIDDIRRNFAMNPQSGLRIRPFRQAHQHRQHDRELIRIAEYLEAIADVEDFRELDHRRWEKYAAKRAKKRANREFRSDLTTLSRQAKSLASLIRSAKFFVAFTGAGISTASGLPDYRGAGGIMTMRARGCQEPVYRNPLGLTPSLTHMSLVGLERAGLLKRLISQNTDGLHRRSGFPPEKLAELHGNTAIE
uniref:FCP1 homology domain-containing protein n=1 Tax=Macrostomum lignano TaxID=282301 RepID=A0A1I8IYQ1_9PLAT